MKATGPHTNRNYYLQDRPRAFFSDLPIGLDAHPDYIHFMDDFRGTLSTIEWETVKDSSAAAAAVADAENGEVALTSAATTDNDGALIQAINTNFLVKSGRQTWFEAKVKVSDADQGEMFIGLADTAATNPEAVIVTGLARVGFELVDGSAVLNMVVDDDTAVTRTSLGISMSDATYVTLGFRTMNDYVLFYVNRTYVGKIAIPSAIAAVTLGPSFFHLSGDANGTHVATADYIFAAMKRV